LEVRTQVSNKPCTLASWRTSKPWIFSPHLVCLLFLANVEAMVG
jgi:hypothetical protein